MIDISSYTNEEICSMLYTVNTWRWDERLGNKPDGFDDLPRYNIHWWAKLRNRKTKEDVLRPIMRALQSRVTHKEFLHYCNVIGTNEMTEEQFEAWYEKTGKTFGGRLGCYKQSDNSN